MVPDKFNMVDMGGIDLIMMQGEAVPGLYDKLMAAISNCRYQCLYNWLFDGVLIPPTYVQIEVDDGEVYLNEGVSVTSDNVIHIYSIEPPAPDPEIIPLLAEENGVYNAPAGKDGFNPVTVDVPSYTPVINSISITENGTYAPPAGVDGYAPISVNVDSEIVYVPYDPEYEQGAVSGNTTTYSANKTSSTIRIRPVDIVDISGFVNDKVLFVWDESLYDITFQQYDSGGIMRQSNSWFTSAFVATIVQPNIVIPIKKKSGETIVSSDFSSAKLKLISLTDSVF